MGSTQKILDTAPDSGGVVHIYAGDHGGVATATDQRKPCGCVKRVTLDHVYCKCGDRGRVHGRDGLDGE